VDVQSSLGIGLLPAIAPEVVRNIANGAGLGAARFLSEEGLVRSIAFAERSEQFYLNTDPQFFQRFVDALH